MLPFILGLYYSLISAKPPFQYLTPFSGTARLEVYTVFFDSSTLDLDCTVRVPLQPLLLPDGRSYGLNNNQKNSNRSEICNMKT